MDKDFFKKCCIFSLSLLLAMSVGIVMFFFFYKIEDVSSWIRSFFSILRPIIYGTVMAYLLRPICRFFESEYFSILDKFNKRKKISKEKKIKISLILAIISTFIIVFLIFFFLLKLIIPQLLASVPLLYEVSIEKLNEIVVYINTRRDSKILTYISNYLENTNIPLEEEALIAAYITPNVSTIFSSLYDGVYSGLLFVKDLIIGIIVSVYLLVYRKKLGKQAKLILFAVFPKKVANIIYDEIIFGDKTFNGFLVGKILDSFIIGSIAYVVLSILQTPFASLVSVIVGVTNIIPFFGPFIGAVPSIVIIFVESPVHALIFIIFILILQQIDGNIIGPKILGSATGVSSLWVLFSILIFGGLFGIPGMVLGIPVFAIIYDITKKAVYKLLYRKKEEDLIREYNKEYHKEIERNVDMENIKKKED